jgi:hypothetical protein
MRDPNKRPTNLGLAELVSIAEVVHPEDPVLGVIADTSPGELKEAILNSRFYDDDFMQLKVKLATKSLEQASELKKFYGDEMRELHLNMAAGHAEWEAEYKALSDSRPDRYRDAYLKAAAHHREEFLQHSEQSINPDIVDNWDDSISQYEQQINEQQIGLSINEDQNNLTKKISSRRNRLGLTARAGIILGSFALFVAPTTLLAKTDFDTLQHTNANIEGLEQQSKTTKNNEDLNSIRTEQSILGKSAEVETEILSMDTVAVGIGLGAAGLISYFGGNRASNKTAQLRARRKIKKYKYE